MPPTAAAGGCAAQAAAASAIMKSLVPPNVLGSSSCSFRSESWKRSMLTLYRTILKLHAIHLQPVQRQFGDKFVRSEFHRHVMANEKYASIFYQSWYQYVAQLDRGVTARNLTRDEEAMLSPEQRQKMGEIRSYVLQQRQTDSDFTL